MYTEQLSPAQAARLFGVTVETLRRWEKAGRISSIRTPGGHRRYSREDVERLLQSKAAS